MISVQALFKSAELTLCGPVAWGEPIADTSSGVYVVTLAGSAVDIDGLPAPLRALWNDGQEVVYIGRGKHLRRRVRQFYKHKHGAQIPHRGGQDKDIILLNRPLLVYWSAVEAYIAKERELIEAFKTAVGAIPFGNRIRAAQSRHAQLQPIGAKT